MSEIQDKIEKHGLYAGNVILEILPDAKGLKPVGKNKMKTGRASFG